MRLANGRQSSYYFRPMQSSKRALVSVPLRWAMGSRRNLVSWQGGKRELGGPQRPMSNAEGRHRRPARGREDQRDRGQLR